MSKCGVISGPHFPLFGLNTGKHGPEITPYLDTFHAVIFKKQYFPVQQVVRECPLDNETQEVYIAGAYNSPKNSSFTKNKDCNVIDTLKQQLAKFCEW